MGNVFTTFAVSGFGLVFSLAIVLLVGEAARRAVNFFRTTVGEKSQGVVILRPRAAPGNDIVEAGRPGVQEDLLPPGSYFTLPWRRKVMAYKLVVVPDCAVGIVTSFIGNADSDGWLSMPYDPAFGDFTNVTAFLAAGGRRGVQEAVLGPGRYAIHPYAFGVTVVRDRGHKNKSYGWKPEETEELRWLKPSTVTTPAGLAIVIPLGGYEPAIQAVASDDEPSVLAYGNCLTKTGNVVVEWIVALPEEGNADKLQRLEDLTDVAFAAVMSGQELLTVHGSASQVLATAQQLEAQAQREMLAQIVQVVFRPTIFAAAAATPSIEASEPA